MQLRECKPSDGAASGSHNHPKQRKQCAAMREGALAEPSKTQNEMECKISNQLQISKRKRANRFWNIKLTFIR